MGKVVIVTGNGTGEAISGEEANFFVFLTSDEATYLTWALFSVDGGPTLSKGATEADTPEHSH